MYCDESACPFYPLRVDTVCMCVRVCGWVCRCSKSRFLQYICTSSRNVIRRPFYCFRELIVPAMAVFYLLSSLWRP